MNVSQKSFRLLSFRLGLIFFVSVVLPLVVFYGVFYFQLKSQLDLVIPQEDVAAEVLGLVRSEGLVLILCGFVTLVLWTYLIRRLVILPVRRLTDTTHRIASGDMSVRVDVDSKDELGELGLSFNVMTENLSRTMASRDELTKEIAIRESVQEELACSRKVLYQIIDHMPIGMVLIDKDRKIRQTNQTMTRIMGLESSENIIGARCSALFCEEGREACFSPLTAHADKPQVVETTIKNRQGQLIPVLRGVIPVDINGEPCFLETYVEIADRVAAEEKLQEAKASAEEASRLKGQFISNVSHEIRTPLNCIIGFAETINYTQAPPLVKEKSLSILREAENLLRMVNDLLDAAKLEAGKIQLEEEPFSIQDMVRGLQQAVDTQVRRKELEFRLFIGASVPQRVKGDQLRIRQVLMNLISNAIKFTERGYIRLAVDVVSLNAGRCSISFEVEDTGIGISDQERRNVFVRFSQVNGTLTRRFGGPGLGTAISQRLVIQMGGAIKFDTKEGKGSRFYFTLPLSVEPGIVTVQNFRSGEGRVLIAEDYPSNQEVVRMHLESVGYSVAVVADGVEALTLCRVQRFDLIIMDLHMPNMDGLAAVEAIRQESPHCNDTPIIALTADTSREMAALCYKKGILEVLLKPIKRQVLLTAVEHWIKRA